MGTTKANQVLAPADEKLSPLIRIVEDANGTDLVANVITHEPEQFAVLRSGIRGVVRLFLVPDPGSRLKTKHLQPTGPLDGYQPHVAKLRRASVETVFVQVSADCHLHITITAPIVPSLAKILEPADHNVLRNLNPRKQPHSGF
jgi:hypothetical protein